MPDSPSPMPVPVNPMDDTKAEEERAAKARDAQIQRAAGGRSSTIVGGMALAADEQRERGLLSKTKREAARALGG